VIASFWPRSVCAHCKTNAWIFAGIVALSATAVLLQWLSNHSLRRRLLDLQQQDGRAVATLAASQRSLKREAAELAALARIQAIATVEAKNQISDYTLSPNYKRSVLLMRPHLFHDYAALFRRLHLNPEQQAKVTQLLLEKRLIENTVASRFSNHSFPGIDSGDIEALKSLVSTGTAEVDGQIREAMGADQFNECQSYAATLGYRSQVNDLAGQLLHSGSPLSDDQADQMAALMAKAQTDVQRLPDAFAGEAAAILNANQMPALKTFLGALQARQTILSMNRAALAHDPPLIPRPSGSGILANLQP
jgi:hypothetical protein